jgi:hypothetical protein
MAAPKMTSEMWHDLPGGEFVAQGLADIELAKESVSALLLQIGATRLSRCGIPVRSSAGEIPDAELRLYRLLTHLHGRDAYSQYKAHLRRLVKLERALESRISRESVPRQRD